MSNDIIIPDYVYIHTLAEAIGPCLLNNGEYGPKTVRINGKRYAIMTPQCIKSASFRKENSRLAIKLFCEIIKVGKTNVPTTECKGRNLLAKYFYAKMVAGDSSKNHDSYITVSNAISLSECRITTDFIALNTDNSKKSGSDFIDSSKEYLDGIITLYYTYTIDLKFLKEIFKLRHPDISIPIKDLKNDIRDIILDIIDMTPWINHGRNYSVKCLAVELMQSPPYGGVNGDLISEFNSLNIGDRNYENAMKKLVEILELEAEGIDQDKLYKRYIWCRCNNIEGIMEDGNNCFFKPGSKKNFLDKIIGGIFEEKTNS